MNEYQLTKVRKQLQRSQEKIEELTRDLEFVEAQLVKVTAERDKYHEEIVITRDSFEKVEEAIAQKMEQIRQQERKSYTAKLDEFERLKRNFDLQKTVTQRLTEENQAKDATISELSVKLRELARRHNQPAFVVNAADIKQSKMASHAQYQKLTEKYSKLCSDMENIVAENRILRRLHGVPENFGFDLEEIKIAEKQELEDYKTQVKHLEAEVEELEAERTQLRYRLRQFNTLYSNKGERYKDFTPEQFELLDEYALNLKEGRVELPQIDKSKKEMEKEIIKLRGMIEVYQRQDPRAIIQPQAPPKESPADMKRYQDEIKSMLQPFLANIKKIAQNAQSQPPSHYPQPSPNPAQPQALNPTSHFRPPAPLPTSHNDWSNINEGFSYTFNSKIPVELKDLFGEIGFDTIQAKYEVAALQLQNIENMKMIREKEIIEKALSEEISQLKDKFKMCLLVQDQLFTKHFAEKQQHDNKVKQMESQIRVINNQKDEITKKLQTMEDSYTAILRKNPGDLQARVIEMTKRLALAQSEVLQLDRKYRTILQEQKSLQKNFTLMEKKSAEIEHNLRQRLLNSKKNEKTLAILINNFLDDSKDMVSSDAHLIVRTRMEILQDKYAALLLKQSELRKRLASIQSSERMANVKEKVIETLQQDSADLQLQLQILRSRLSSIDPDYHRYEEIFGKFVEFVKVNSISLVTFFKKFDTSGDGRLNKDELTSAFAALNFKVNEGDMNAVFEFFDLDGSGQINYKEFLKKLRRSGITMRTKEQEGVCKLYKAIVDANFTLRKAFDAIDKDGSNTISKGQMQSAFLKIGIPITSDTVDFIFRLCDSDMDNSITYAQFQRIFSTIVGKSEAQQRSLFQTQLNWKYAVLLKIQQSAAANKMSVVEAFEMIDKDGSKKITVEELNQMFKKSGIQVSRNNLLELFNMVDKDRSRSVNYSEFLELIREAHVEKERIDRIKAVQKRAEEIRKEYGVVAQADVPKVSEEGTYKMRIMAIETKFRHLNKRHELLAKELAHRQQEVRELKNSLTINQKAILKAQHQQYTAKQQFASLQQKTRGQLSREQSDQLRAKYHKHNVQNSQIKSTLEVYRGLYDSIVNKSKSQELRLEKVEAERLKFYDIVKELQGKSDQNALAGKLTIELEQSKINEGLVNQRYDKTVDELRVLNDQVNKLKTELGERQTEVVNTHLFLREKSAMLQRNIDSLSSKQLPGVSLERVEELALRLRDVAFNKSELQQSNKKLRQDNFQLQLRNDYLQMDRQAVQKLEQQLRKSHPDQLSQQLIELSHKLGQYKIIQLKCKRQSSLLKQKEQYYLRINHTNQQNIKQMQSELAKWQSKYGEREEFWRKRMIEQSKLAEAFQAQQDKARKAEQYAVMNLSKIAEESESERQLEKKLIQVDEVRRSKMNLSQIRKTESSTGEGEAVRGTRVVPKGSVGGVSSAELQEIEMRLFEKDKEIDQLKAKLRELTQVARQLPQMTEFGIGQSMVMTDSKLQTDLTASSLRQNAVRFVQNQKHREQFFQEQSERLAQAAQQSIQTLQRIIDDKNEQLRRKDRLIQDLKADFLHVKDQDTQTIQRLNQQIAQQARAIHQQQPVQSVQPEFMMRSTNKFGNRSSVGAAGELQKEINLKNRQLIQLQEKYDALCMESAKKPRGGDQGEIKRLQLKVKDLEAEREIERAKFMEQENEFKRRIGNLEKLSKEKDAKLTKLQKSLLEVKRDILGQRKIDEKQIPNLQGRVTGSNVNDSQLQIHLQKALQTIQQLTGEKRAQKEQIDRLVKKSKDQDEQIRKMREESKLRRTGSVRK